MVLGAVCARPRQHRVLAGLDERCSRGGRGDDGPADNGWQRQRSSPTWSGSWEVGVWVASCKLPVEWWSEWRGRDCGRLALEWARRRAVTSSGGGLTWAWHDQHHQHEVDRTLQAASELKPRKPDRNISHTACREQGDFSPNHRKSQRETAATCLGLRGFHVSHGPGHPSSIIHYHPNCAQRQPRQSSNQVNTQSQNLVFEDSLLFYLCFQRRRRYRARNHKS